MNERYVSEPLSSINPMFAVINAGSGALLCLVEARDSEEAARRASAIARMYGWQLGTEDLWVAPIHEWPPGTPTFYEEFFAQDGLFVPASGRMTLH